MMILLFKVPRNKVKNTIAICSTTVLASLLCCIGLPKSANAATFFTRYDLGDQTLGNNGRRDGTSFTYDDINLDDPILTVRAREKGVAGTVARTVRQRSNGLGIIGQDGRNGQIDGRGGTFEELLLSFNQTVRIVSASFSAVNQNNDGFRLLVDGNTLVTRRRRLNALENNTFDFSSFSAGERTGSEFTFTVSQRNDDYRLRSVTVATDIPESTSVLSLLAVGLIGVASRRKVKNF